MPTKTSKDQGKTDTGETPLFTAARKGHVEVVPFLVGSGADRPRHDGCWGNAPFHGSSSGALSSRPISGGVGCQQRLRHDNWFRSSASTFAANEGHLEVVQFLVGSGSFNDQSSNGIFKF